MQQADILVQHSCVSPTDGDEEGLPLAILEAMAAGLPIVATRHAGIPDAVVDGETGYLVDEGDVDGMAGRICEIARFAEDRHHMGAVAWQRAKERFSTDRTVVELSKLIRAAGVSSQKAS